MQTKIPKDLDEIWSDTRKYFRIRLEIAKLGAIEKGTGIAADLVTNTVVVICLLMSVLAGTVTLAFYLSHLLKSYALGFGSATIFILLMASLLLWKKIAFEKFISGVVIRRYLAKHRNRNDQVDSQVGESDVTNNVRQGSIIPSAKGTGPDKNSTRIKKKVTLKGIWEVLKDSFGGFGEHKVTKLSGSLAYYTVFSMAPLLVVIISLCGLILGQEAAEGKVYGELAGFMGREAALQLEEIVSKAAIGDKGTVAFIIGIATLLVGATTVFSDIQDSINTIWGLKPKPKKGWLKMLQNRFLSFSVIVSLGFLLLVSLGVTAVLDGFSGRLQARFSEISVVVFYVLNQIVTLAVVSLIFGVIFKVLPDAIIKWRDVIYGSVVTALLFMLGKLCISIYIGQSDVGGTYGAAGSLIILLLWTYYSSIILYFGAEFTKAYAVAYGSEIHPSHYAVTMKEVEVETPGHSVQESEKH